MRDIVLSYWLCWLDADISAQRNTKQYSPSWECLCSASAHRAPAMDLASPSVSQIFFFFFFHKHTGEKCACDLLSSRGTRCRHCPGYTQTFTELETHCGKQFFKYDGHLSFKRYEAFTCKWSLLTCIQTISLQNKYKLIVVLTKCACMLSISFTVYAMDMNDSLINLLGDETFSWWTKEHEKE